MDPVKETEEAIGVIHLVVLKLVAADKRRKGGDKERCKVRSTKAARRGRRRGDVRRGGSGGEERKKERHARRQWR
ncbi:hypothetical protein ACOSP7_004289 [Xanthoceras sorbifolium]